MTAADFLIGVAVGVWADLHFYCQHRLMHLPSLYARFHKVSPSAHGMHSHHGILVLASTRSTVRRT